MSARKKNAVWFLIAGVLVCGCCIYLVNQSYRKWHGQVVGVEWEVKLAEDGLRDLAYHPDLDQKRNFCAMLHDDVGRYSLAGAGTVWRETTVRDHIERALKLCNEAPPPVGASIGVATMNADGTVTLRLRASSPEGMTGETQLVYPKDHKDYQEILNHLGGLKPGESKPVPPWPDKP